MASVCCNGWRLLRGNWRGRSDTITNCGAPRAGVLNWPAERLLDGAGHPRRPPLVHEPGAEPGLNRDVDPASRHRYPGRSPADGNLVHAAGARVDPRNRAVAVESHPYPPSARGECCRIAPDAQRDRVRDRGRPRIDAGEAGGVAVQYPNRSLADGDLHRDRSSLSRSAGDRNGGADSAAFRVDLERASHRAVDRPDGARADSQVLELATDVDSPAGLTAARVDFEQPGRPVGCPNRAAADGHTRPDEPGIAPEREPVRDPGRRSDPASTSSCRRASITQTESRVAARSLACTPAGMTFATDGERPSIPAIVPGPSVATHTDRPPSASNAGRLGMRTWSTIRCERASSTATESGATRTGGAAVVGSSFPESRAAATAAPTSNRALAAISRRPARARRARTAGGSKPSE